MSYAPALLRALRRWDRRLILEPQPGKLGLHQVVMVDRLGERVVVCDEMPHPGGGDEMFRRLHKAAPWRANQTYGSRRKQLERAEKDWEESRYRLPDGLHEDAYDGMRFYENHPDALRRWKEQERKDREKFEAVVEKYQKGLESRHAHSA